MSVWTPPSDEQLVNFVAFSAYGPGVGKFEKDTVRELLRAPGVRQVWLDRHRAMQESLSAFVCDVDENGGQA